ncbi:MAG: TolC family protein [Planctomycetota bacterium]|nr:TolC family protein [Planctomycetota bacterium]
MPAPRRHLPLGPRHPASVLMCCGCAALLFSPLPGCSRSPLFPHQSDYAPDLSLERVRRIEAAPIEHYRVESPPPSVQDARAAQHRFEGVERVELSIAECRAAALEHNLDLQVALLSPALAAERIAEEEGRFDSVFTLNAQWSETDTPTASTLDSAQAKFQRIEPGVRIPLRTGGTATVTLPFNRNETNNRFSTLNPAYTSDLVLSISQPLLRNAGRRASTYAITIASYDRQLSEVQTKAEVIRQLAAVDRAYWRLYGARAALDVRLRSLELAQAQLEQAERRYDAGDVAEIEVLRAQAGVAEQLDSIIRAQNLLITRQRELKRIINMPGLDIATETQVVPGSPPDPVRYEFDTETLTQAAIDSRMEMLEFELRLAADLVTADWSRNQALPLLALDYTYRMNGLGGSLSQSVDLMQENRFADWSIGLRGEVPLGNEQREAAVRRSLLTRLQRLASRDAREQTIRREVLDAVDQIDSAWQRIFAARQSVILNTRTLQAEQRQFDVGQSTSTDVLNSNTRLSDAQLQEINAVVEYQIAQVDLAFATGTLLGASRVEFQPADPLGTTADRTGEPGWTDAAPETEPAPESPPEPETLD